MDKELPSAQPATPNQDPHDPEPPGEQAGALEYFIMALLMLGGILVFLGVVPDMVGFPGDSGSRKGDDGYVVWGFGLAGIGYALYTCREFIKGLKGEPPED